ncbi:hypothetical protein AGABI1DRAFT_135247 [Agaricus bisporus var. burnettii JB137-S8]|uniref:Uncharacterized protein n=1 Tax=Agaricus bisporus var. burnettii (strain JB137-S8 / ATCC MYA-4627 / FGSC 10392) TaxID=597362 RepID=K5WDD6_AGABU|nr:uncharacterized protein AGABI1DRAFT_135247 [Agaricus bisporus var. burnettii JB137-S8]EKM73246.1 hypothetical protein AGABI1DRAFT_135247 [Agaricus bisporus var. burnettii JB137-S8]
MIMPIPPLLFPPFSSRPFSSRPSPPATFLPAAPPPALPSFEGPVTALTLSTPTTLLLSARCLSQLRLFPSLPTRQGLLGAMSSRYLILMYI